MRAAAAEVKWVANMVVVAATTTITVVDAVASPYDAATASKDYACSLSRFEACNLLLSCTLKKWS